MTWYTQLGTVIGPLVITISAAAKWIARQMHKRDDERDEKVREIVYGVLEAHMSEEESSIRRVEKRQAKLGRELKTYVQADFQQHAHILARLDALDKHLTRDLPTVPQD